MLNDNYRAIAPLLGREDLVALARNSFLGSFLSDEQVVRHVAEVESYAVENFRRA